MAKNYKITITDSATYIINAEIIESAKELAVEWFSEREPSIKIEETDEEAEYSV